MTQLGYSFPHRPGSKFCQHAPRPSDEALQARAEAMGLAVWSDDEGVPF